MTTWTDEHGTKLRVIPGVPAKLTIHEEGAADAGVFELDDLNLLTDISIEMFRAAGQPAPVITPRPDVDPGHDFVLGTLRMRLGRGMVSLAAGEWEGSFPPADARRAAGFLVALADAAEAWQPDPADVEALARLIESGREEAKAHPHGGVMVYADTLARHLLRSGVALPGKDGGRG